MSASSLETHSSSYRLHRTIGVGLVLVSVVALAIYICLFKLIDNDFFWHIKSGEIMWKTSALIREEPYSYVLQGKPYGALHEWLAQILFYLVHRAGGVVGSILLRGIAVAIAALIILSFDILSVWITAPVVVWAVYAHRASLMVRPQLFTIVLLCSVLALLLRYLRRHESESLHATTQRNTLLAVIGLQILWVNIHGASAIFGVFAAGAVFLQGWYDWYRSDAGSRAMQTKECRFRSVLLGLVALSMLASPSFFKTFVDMYMHRFDGTIPLVREWMPLVWHDYATDVLPFGLLALTLILLRRRAWVFSLSLLLIAGLLSLQAYRHCILFVCIALSIAFFQLAAYDPWLRIRAKLIRFPLITAACTVAVLLMLLSMMYQRDLRTVFRNNDFGFGVSIPVIGAANFVEKEGITGTMFNTYNQGGYLLYRFAPERKVFADGRNIEYGYPFVQKILDAGTNPARWKELDEQYRFTYAIVEYKAMPEYGMTRPYISNFDTDPSWKLVYLDDLATVYVRDLPPYKDIIKKYTYKVLTPAALEFTDVLGKLSDTQWMVAERELLRLVKDSPESVKARIILANRYIDRGRPDEAKKLALEAIAAQPYMSELYEIVGRIAVAKQDWSEAGDALEKAAQLVSRGGPEINYDFLAMVFSRAGQNDKAELYHKKALRAGQASPVVSEN